MALLAGLDGCGDVGAGIDEGACLDEELDDISIGTCSTSDEDELIVSGGEERTLITSGLFTASSSDDW